MPLRLTVVAVLLLLYNAVSGAPQPAGRQAVPVAVKRILIDPVSNSPVVLLEALDTDSVVPIWIGPSEATSIALELEQRKLPRPNTHDLIQRLLGALDAKLDRVTVTELKENTYFAVITIKSGDRELHIDSRPSDAIAVALRAGAPIYAAPELLSRGTGLHSVPSPREATTVQETMGLQVQTLTPSLADLLNAAEKRGVLISDVTHGGLGSRAGFQRGDVITRVNEARITNTDELEQAFKSPERSQRLDVQIQRGGKPMTIAVDLPPNL